MIATPASPSPLPSHTIGKEPRSNPNNHMRKKTKPPTSHDPYANMPDTVSKRKRSVHACMHA